MKNYQKKRIRLLTFLCVLSLITSILPLPVAAEGTPTPIVSVDTVTVSQGSSCDVYVRAENLENLQLIMLAVEYDTAALTLMSSSLVDMQMGGINTNEAGRVQLSVMDASGVSGNVTLMQLTFKANKSTEIGSYPLTLKVLEARGADYTEISVEKVSGAVAVTKAEIPTAYFSLSGSNAVNAGEDVTIQLYSWNLADLSAGQFSFIYDSEYLTFKKAQLLDAFQVEDATFSVNDRNEGQVVVAYATPAAPAEGYLMELVFTARENVVGMTSVSCTPSNLYSEAGNLIKASAVAMEVSIQETAETPETAVFWLHGDESLSTNSTITLTAMVDGFSGLAAADFVIEYSTDELQCVSAEAVQGADESLDSVSVFLNPAYTNGSIQFSLIAPDGITQDTALVRIQFQAAQNENGVAVCTTQVIDPVDEESHAVEMEAQEKTITVVVPSFTVTFLDHDGTVLKTQQVDYLSAAAAPSVGGIEPTETLHYVHTGWDKTYDSITENLVVTALYEEETHTWDDGKITTTATCTSDGVFTKTCYRCPKTQTAVITATGHTEKAPVKENEVQATCMSEGHYDSVVYCLSCNAELQRAKIILPKLGHRYQAPVFHWTDDLSACQASFTCNVCDAGTERKELNCACDLAIKETEAATCTKTGQKIVTATVTLGDNTYTDQKTQNIPIKEHEWKDHVCTACGQKDAYFVYGGNAVTVFAAQIAKDTRVLIAGYTESGQMVTSVLETWGDTTSMQINLPDGEKAAVIRVYFLDANWCPLRDYISQ